MIKNSKILLFMAVLIFGIFLLPGTVTAANNGSTTIVSSADNGTQANGAVSTVSMSDDGRYITYASAASNLVENDTNAVSDIFVKDLVLNITKRISLANDGTQANGACTTPYISGNGKFVTYTSAATNLVANDDNKGTDVFLYNMLNNTTTLISISLDGTVGDKASVQSTISDDGRYVTFASLATNLVSGDTYAQQDIFLRDTLLNTTKIISVAENGTQADKASAIPMISGNGKYVVFRSQATTLVANDPSTFNQIFLYDLVNNKLKMVSTNVEGKPGNSNSMSVTIDDNGQYIAFYSTATDIVYNDTNGYGDAFLFNTATNTTTIISRAPDGTLADGQSWYPILSDDGRYIAYASQATNLVTYITDNNSRYDHFLYDTKTNITTLLSIAADGTSASGGSTQPLTINPAISADGRYIAFISTFTNLIPNDTNNFADVFLRDTAIQVFSTDDLQSIIDNATSGQWISLAENITGNLVISNPLNIAGNGFTITAADAGVPVIRLTGAANETTINGLTITGATGSYGLVLDNVNNVTVTNNTISGNFVGLKLINSTDNTFTDNNITSLDNTPPAVSVDVTTGVYNASKTVNLTSDDANSIIYYTTDGTDPTVNSTVYSGPIAINGTTTLKYVAVDEAGNWSSIYTQNYTIDTVAPTATASVNGGLFNSDQSVTLTAADDNNTTIYYTTNGSDPTSSSTVYTGPITINSSTTLKYIVVDEAGNWSPVYTQAYAIDKVKPTTTASVKGGTYNTSKSVTLSMSENGTIYYTIDGSTPTTGSTVYTEPITVNSSTTLKFIAVDEAGNVSGVQSETYVIDTVKPVVNKIDPVNGAVNVSVAKTIKVTFNEAIKAGTLWVELKNSSGKAVDFTKSISGKVLTIDPKSNLAESLYTLIIHTYAVKDVAGNPVALKSTKFSVGTSPLMSKVDPKNGATKVAAGKTIKVTFSEAIKAGTLWVELKNSSGKVVTFTKSISGRVLTIDPKSNLAESLYTLIIHTGAVKDLAGNPVTLKSSKFIVGTAPTVSKVDPKNGATKVSRSKTIKVTFNESIKAGSYWIELKSKNGTVKINSKSISGKVLSIRHAKLAANTKYNLIIHTGSVTDKAGNPFALKTYTFNTGKT